MSLNPAVRTFLLNTVQSQVTGSIEVGREVKATEYDLVERQVDSASQKTRFETIDVNDIPITITDPNTGESITDSVFQGWAVSRGDEVTYIVRDSEGEDIRYFNRITNVIDGSDDDQDDISNGIKRITFADPIELSGTQSIGPDMVFRNRSRLAVEGNFDWQSLYSNMAAVKVSHEDAGQPIDRQLPQGTNLLGWDETENYLLLSDRIDTQDFTAAIAVDENGGSLKGSGYTTNQNFKVGVTFEPSPPLKKMVAGE